MGWSIRIARLGGTDIRIHITFLLFLAFLGFSNYQQGGHSAAVNAVAFMTLLFTCVLLHELGHAFAARQYGIGTPDITLLPIGGVARLQRMPEKPLEEIVVALAGPAVNVAIAAILYLFVRLDGSVSLASALAGDEETMLTRLFFVNIALVLFNLIPAFPMDGGRVLRAVLAMKMPYGRASQMAASVGQAFAFLFGFVGLFANPMLIFIAFFIYIGASQEASAAALRDLSRNLSVSDAMQTSVLSLHPYATAGDAAEALLRSAQHEFPVTDGNGRVVGILMRDSLIKALRDHGRESLVADAMRRDIPVILQSAAFSDAFQQMQECNCPALPVVDSWGRLTGMITTEGVGQLMMIHAAAPRSGVTRSSPWPVPASR